MFNLTSLYALSFSQGKIRISLVIIRGFVHMRYVSKYHVLVQKYPSRKDSDTLIGYLPFFQMLPKPCLRIGYTGIILNRTLDVLGTN